MDAAGIDASMHGIARERSATVTIVADGSHHGANAYFREAQHDSAAENKQRSPLEIRDSVQSQDETALEVNLDERTKPFIKRIWDHVCWHLQGGLDSPPVVPGVVDLLWSWAGAFCSILLLSGLTQWLEPAYNLPLLYASFGASAVLVFGVISSPLAQPRNLVGGQVLSAIVGCCIRLALGHVLWLSAPLGMSLALLVMMLTRTTHPPGGATAILSSIAQPLAPWAGFKFVISILLGSVGMLLVALIFNNAHPEKRYPTYWY